MLELHYPTVTKTILERQYPGKPTLKVAFGNGNGAIFENSSKLRASLFVTSRWPRSSGQTNYQVHHPPPPCLRDSKASETRARVKITPREKGETLASRSLHYPRGKMETTRNLIRRSPVNYLFKCIEGRNQERCWRPRL